MKIAFLGTSAFAVPALKALVEAGHEVVAVYTRAPKPAGRGQQERKTPVHQTADALGLPVRTPKSLRNEEEAAAFKALDLDAAVVVSYGHILPKSFLEAPVLGCINIHGSLLPRWRGAAPIHRALLAGDPETGVTTMRMDEGLDTGPMLLAERTPISAADTAQTVHDRLAEMGATLIVSTLDGLMRKTLEPVPQPEEGVTYAHKLGKEEGLLDWRRPAAELERKVRAFHPWPGTFFDAPKEGGLERIKVLEAGLALAAGAAGTLIVGRDGFPVVACASGGLRLLRLQRPGKAAQAADAFLRGFALPAGTVLPSPTVVPFPQTKPG
ncbi:methionyl-tRNA formyltransferase [Enhydrobacter aerosaccus]|uniref:Methionyl-tRNA formyltransferase n=1 Tax=Enhydrobacter aerosaccus TaxID=225324 RepID=A0A1T4NMG9_9HYPH|nr:methionyl-tRNA formyltransferase [Enhydrobacter aerosaccus]SJZ80353.1 methionyl-tRNA formyltransferase [Enhydrobacter aerosaccus]